MLGQSLGQSLEHLVESLVRGSSVTSALLAGTREGGLSSGLIFHGFD